MKVLRVIFSVILSIVFVIVLSGGIFLYSISSLISKDNIQNMVSEIGYEEIIKADSENNIEIDEEYLKNPEIKELFEKFIGQAADYITGNADIPEITDEDIERIVNSDYYEKELGIKLSEEEKAKYKEELKEAYASNSKNLENELTSIKTELFEDDIIKAIFVENSIFYIIISLIILAILIGICRWSWYRPLSWIGTSMIVASSLNIFLSTILSWTFSSETNDFLTANITNYIFKSWLNNSFIVLSLGVLLLVGYFVLGYKLGKNEEDKLVGNL